MRLTDLIVESSGPDLRSALGIETIQFGSCLDVVSGKEDSKIIYNKSGN